MNDSLNDALAAAEVLFGELYRGEWDSAAATIGVEAAEAFRRQQLATLVVWAHHRDEMRVARETGVGTMGWSSDGTINEAWLAEQASMPLPRLPRARTLGALAQLPAVGFLALYLEVSNPRRGAAEGGPMDRSRRRIVGGVPDGQDVVHVLYRRDLPGDVPDDPSNVNLGMLRRSGGVWRFDITRFGQDVVDGAWFMMVADDDFGGSAPEPLNPDG